MQDYNGSSYSCIQVQFLPYTHKHTMSAEISSGPNCICKGNINPYFNIKIIICDDVWIS
jgi:hypothetical protein